jgi:hypothetical protein
MDAFAEAESDYQDEAMRVLGLELDDQEQEQMLADDFLAQRLFDAGYFVTEWGVSSGELEMGRGPEEAT